MILNIDAYLHYNLVSPTGLILQIEAAATPEQTIQSASIAFSEIENFARVAAEADIGERLLMNAHGHFSCRYISTIEINRAAADIETLQATPPHLLPGDIIRYLMPSRYCPSDQFLDFIAAEFGHLEGGARIVEISNWINKRFAYVSGSSSAQTTALETFVQRKGVCRDFAHLLITLARASSIPARFASAYAPRIVPQDFHAVAEVYLDGAWHLIDPTKMAEPHEMAIIGVGMDAAEVAFMTSYGYASLFEQNVIVNVA
ncbi:MAG: transglutaminase family protein [Salaquimonas sp.]